MSLLKAKTGIAILSLILLISSGCNILPSPGSLIKAPKLGTVEKKPASQVKKLVESFLPEGAKLIAPPNPQGADVIQEADFNGDGKKEIMATYKIGGNDGKTGAFILQKLAGVWTKIWEKENDKYVNLDYFGYADITGNGRPELLVASSIGASAGSGLQILEWNNDTPGDNFRSLGVNAYHKIDVADMPGKYGMDGKAEMALWQKDTGDAYMVNVYRWMDIGFVPAEDSYPYYYPKVVEYYKQKIKEMPDAWFYWYYLADAQVKAESYEDGLRSANKAIALSQYKTLDYLLFIKAQALDKLGKNVEAQDIYQKIVTVKSKSEEFTKIQQQTYVELGKSYTLTKDYQKAKKMLQKAINISQTMYKKGTNEQILQAYTAQKALDKLNAIIAENKITSYLSKTTNQNIDKALIDFKNWGTKNGVTLNYQKVENLESGVPEIILIDFSNDPSGILSMIQGHAIYWWDSDNALKSQIFYSADYDEHGLSNTYSFLNARSSEKSGKLEIGIVFDSITSGSGSPAPVYKLLQLNNDNWDIIWSSPRENWRNSHGKLTFSGSGLSEMILEGDSWYIGDKKQNIFQESNAGPHRQFQDRWVRKGDMYDLVSSKTLPSAYNTLVEFIYELSNNNENATKALVTDYALVTKAKTYGLLQKPLGQMWIIDLNTPSIEQKGPIKILTGPAKGVKIFFINKNGQYYISGIYK